MKNQPQINGNQAPSPPHSMEKTHYQTRKGVTPTKTYYKPAFPGLDDHGIHGMAAGYTEGYTGINGKEPTPPEKGVAPNQATRGKMNNSFKRND